VGLYWSETVACGAIMMDLGFRMQAAIF